MYIWNIIKNDQYNVLRVEIKDCTLHQLCELADRIDIGLGSVEVLKFHGAGGRLFIKIAESFLDKEVSEIRPELQKLINLL